MTFTLGANNGDAITSQTATCTSTNGGVTRSASYGGTPAPIGVSAVTTGKTYTCTITATNARGTGLPSQPSHAVIVGSPAAPTVTAVQRVAAGQIRVTYTLDTNNGSAVTSQAATCTSTNGGATKTATRIGNTAAPITVTALTVGKTYTCTVTATNARGTGLASKPSAGVTA